MGKVDWKERVLGMRAVEKRFITEKQLTECLNTKEFFEPDKSLADIFLTKGYLTRNQIKRLDQEFDEETEIKHEGESTRKLFGDLAIEQSMITEPQLLEALDVQGKYLERGLRTQIGQILAKKGYVTIAQVRRIVDSQLKKVLVCIKCNTTKVITSYDPSGIYQCENCYLDMIESKVQKPTRPPETEDEDEGEEDGDEDLGLNVIEL